MTRFGAVRSGAAAFAEAGVTPADIKYASIYDSFTITVLMQLEDLGFCEKGKGGAFVSDGNLISGIGKLPFNTDGGGLCNNHPSNRGGLTKVLEAVRQLRGEAHPAVQVKSLRPRARARHRRLARHPPRQRHRRAGKGIRPMTAQQRKIAAPQVNAGDETVSGTPRRRASCWSRSASPAARSHHYPRSLCPFCFSDKTDWQPASGAARSISYSVMRRAPVPYAIALCDAGGRRRR